MANVRLEKVTKKFDRQSAIQDISFEVPDGEFWVLVGPSGCGKSTILRTIAGLEAVGEGKIYIGNMLVNNIPARERDVAMVFQNYSLYPHLTVSENLSFGLKMRKVEPEKINYRIETVAKMLNIEHLLSRKPKQLSGGQQQRVALGRAIIRQPQVFLLDEPLSNLDAQLRYSTRTELKQLHQQVKITTIYVTHDQVEAMTLADRIVVVNKGVLQQIGTPQEIYSQPRNSMVATFMGNPPMNLLPAIYLNGTFVIENKTILISTKILNKLNPKQGQAFNIGIRPENITLSSQEKDCLQVEIDVIEPLGRETLVKSILPGTNITVNLIAPSTWRASRGDRLMIEWDEDNIFLFDPSTGEKL